MTALLTGMFLALLASEAAGAGVFAWVYYRRGEWRASAIGRHLLFYGTTLSLLYLITFGTMLWPNVVLVALLMMAHLVWNAAIWQRVYLVLKAPRQEEVTDGQG